MVSQQPSLPGRVGVPWASEGSCSEYLSLSEDLVIVLAACAPVRAFDLLRKYSLCYLTAGEGDVIPWGHLFFLLCYILQWWLCPFLPAVKGWFCPKLASSKRDCWAMHWVVVNRYVLPRCIASSSLWDFKGCSWLWNTALCRFSGTSSIAIQGQHLHSCPTKGALIPTFTAGERTLTGEQLAQ